MEIYKLAHSGKDLDDAIAGRFTTEVLDVTENGSYTPGDDVDGYSQVNVDVQPPLEELIVSENGEYEPSEGVYGFSKVKAAIKFSYERSKWYRPLDWPDYSTITLGENETYITVDTYMEVDGMTPRLYLTSKMGYSLQRGKIENGQFVVIEDMGTGTLIGFDKEIPQDEGRYITYKLYDVMDAVEIYDTSVSKGIFEQSRCRIVEIYSNSIYDINGLICSYTELVTETGSAHINASLNNKTSLQYVDFSKAISENTTLYSMVQANFNLRYLIMPSATVTNVAYFPYNCGNLSYLDMSNIVADAPTSMLNFCRDCGRLNTLLIKGWDLSAVTNVNYMFDNCYSLENLMLDEVILPAVSFSLSDSTLLTVDSLVGVIAALPTLAEGTAATLTLGATNTAKLTAEQLAVATEKGWTVA